MSEKPLKSLMPRENSLLGTSQLFQMLQEVEEVRGSLDLTTQRSLLISTDVVSIGAGGRSHVGVG